MDIPIWLLVAVVVGVLAFVVRMAWYLRRDRDPERRERRPRR